MRTDFDIDLVFHDRSQFLDVHLEAAVSADRPHPFIRPGQFHADGHGQAAAHGAGTAGRKPAVDSLEIVITGQDHLVLPHIADDNITFPRSGRTVGTMVLTSNCPSWPTPLRFPP
jgi:hypothetical protein